MKLIPILKSPFAALFICTLVGIGTGASVATAQVENITEKVATGEGYSPLKPGSVRVWDLGRKYSYKHYWPQRQWDNRKNWILVPYGKTGDYQFHGDCMLEGQNFWVSLHASDDDACFIYAKKDEEGTPSRHNEFYRSYDQPGGLRTYCHSYEYNRIVKNDENDIIVESKTKTRVRNGVSVAIINRYRVQGGKPYLESYPVNEMASEQGMHGESRIHISPESLDDGQSDFLADAWRNPPNKSVYHPHTSRMLLDFIMDDDLIWGLMWKTVGKIPGSDHPYFSTRARSDNCEGGYQAGWQRIGEGDSPLIFTAPFVKYRQEKLVLGVMRVGHWHYQKIGATVEQGKDFAINWKYVHQRQVDGCPFAPGGAWWPMYAGQWRLVSSIDGRHYTTPIPIDKNGIGQKSLVVRPAASGNLEYVMFYLYDRSADTDKKVWTLQDIYRDAFQQF